MESSHLQVFTPAGRSNAVLPCRVSCLVRLMLFAYDASESYPLRILSLLLDGSFLTFRNGVLSPPSFHFRRSFKRGSILSGILPRTAHVVRLRCKRVLTTQNINVCAFLFLGCSTSVERVFQIVLLIRCTINLTSSRKSFVHI